MAAKDVLTKAQDEVYSIGAFNAANIETLKAIVGAAAKLRAPIIVESSHGETEFIGAANLVDLVKNYREETGVPIFINLDHAPSVEAAEEGIEAGYELIHINASKLPYEENVAATKKVAEEAHAKGLLVEAELTFIEGSSAPHLQEKIEEEQAKSKYTDPEQAKDFVSRTGIDTLAVSIGNVHGVYKTAPKLDLELLRTLRQTLPCFFSLHGGSGIPDDQVRGAIKTGRIVKVNVNSEMRIAYRETLEKVLKKTDEVAIYKIMPDVIAAVQEVVERKIKLFGSEGKAT
ncbi:ketose-bisphosphate aldolase [Candidatus Saccharibacteria bacterium]|nr:ketose-bisphosphate aldolase [Candidatus Saccharibacteria bacterium]